jgi:nicotinate-nucleotide adenylyltransferase
MDFGTIEAELLSGLELYCKPWRQEHSKSTAALCERLCARFGLDPRLGRMAGLGHDLLKDWPIELQWETALRAQSISDLPASLAAAMRLRSEPQLGDKMIHGPAAAVYLYEKYGPGFADISEAIAQHSSAALHMSSLAKILYVSDKLEPLRPRSTPEDLVALREYDLDALFVHSLGQVLEWLKSKGHSIAQSTLDLYNAMVSARNS